MDKPQLRSWLNHPVSRELKDLLVEHREAVKAVLDQTEFEITTIGISNKLKGQLNTLDMIIDLENFLSEKLIAEKVEIEEDGNDL